MKEPPLPEFEFDFPSKSIRQHQRLDSAYEEYQPFKFANVDAWPEIQDIVDSNSKGLDQLSIPFDTDADILVSLIAKQLHIRFREQHQPLSLMTVVHFKDQDTPQKTIMSGFHYSSDYNLLDDNRTLHQVMINSPEKLDGDMKRYFYAIQALLSDMLIRDISYGYIATPEKMRVFSIVKSKGTQQLNVKVSPAIVSSERYRVLLGMALHIHHKSPFLDNEGGVFVEPVQATHPPMWVLKDLEPSPPPCESWKKSTLRLRAYKLCCHWQVGPRQPLPGFLYGVLRTDSRNQDSGKEVFHRAYSPVVVKHAPIIDSVASTALANEAMMYEYLMSKQCPFVPTRILYATLLDSITLLCLEPFGCPLDASDFPAATRLVKKAVCSLHQKGVLHGDIKLGNFYKKADSVVIANFHKSKFYKVVPAELAAGELKQVELLCAQGDKDIEI